MSSQTTNQPSISTNQPRFESYEALYEACVLPEDHKEVSSDTNPLCPLCLDSGDGGEDATGAAKPKPETIVRVPCCGQTMGSECLEQWLGEPSASGKCPHCRAKLVVPPPKESADEADLRRVMGTHDLVFYLLLRREFIPSPPHFAAGFGMDDDESFSDGEAGDADVAAEVEEDDDDDDEFSSNEESGYDSM